MKKHICLYVFLLSFFVLAGCHARKESPYNRNSNNDYELFLSKHVFAACQNENEPFALYSLAKLNKTPSNNDPRYKVTFVNGPCKGQAVWTTHVLLKTEPVGSEELPRGTALLRNYWNPKEPFDQEKTDRWHIGIVSDNSRVSKGIVDLAFPRDRNDFAPAREGIYLHNVRHVVLPEVKDVRTFIH